MCFIFFFNTRHLLYKSTFEDKNSRIKYLCTVKKVVKRRKKIHCKGDLFLQHLILSRTLFLKESATKRRNIWDQDNSPQRQLAPRQLAPKKTRPKTTRPTFRRQLAPLSEDNSPHSEDNSSQLVNLLLFENKVELF